MTNKHDYAEALEDFISNTEDPTDDPNVHSVPRAVYWNKKSIPAIIHALKLAQKVTGEPSVGMALEGCKVIGGEPVCYQDVGDMKIEFKAMITQACKEIEQ